MNQKSFTITIEAQIITVAVAAEQMHKNSILTKRE